jgi:DNA-binding transcriptional LysR family regulator
MPPSDLNSIAAFLAVARERSFTRAAAQLGISQSALSQTIRGFESELGVRLLTRTTRSVAPTRAGERLVDVAGKRLEEIEATLAMLRAARDEPGGTIRITAHDHALRTVLWPAAASLLKEYPDIRIEVNIDYGLTDIVSDRFEAGIRLGGMVAKDMVALRVGPDQRSAVVGAPSYFADHPTPRAPQDLTAHACINLRLPTLGGLYAWEFERGGHEVRVRVEGPFTCNGTLPMLDAALAGLGLAYVPEDEAARHVAAGRLVRVLEDWCPPYDGYHLYYPSRRDPTAAFRLLIEELRRRAPP